MTDVSPQPLEHLRCNACREMFPCSQLCVTGNLRGETWYHCLRCARIQNESLEGVLGDTGLRRKPRPSAEEEWANRPFAWDEEGNFLG